MQKLINLLALASFGVSACVVGAGAYVYLNKDALMEQAKAKVMASVGEAIGGNLAGAALEGAVPMPSSGAGSPVPLPIASPF